METELLMWGLLVLAIVTTLAAGMQFGYRRGFQEGQLAKVGDLIEAYEERQARLKGAALEGPTKKDSGQ